MWRCRRSRRRRLMGTIALVGRCASFVRSSRGTAGSSASVWYPTLSSASSCLTLLHTVLAPLQTWMQFAVMQ